MKAMKWISYTEFKDARLTAGLSFLEARLLLDVSERTYMRWKHDERVPSWACQIMSLLSGDLSHFGWVGWEVRNGKLFQIDLIARHHFWTQADVLMTAYCPCAGRSQIKAENMASLHYSMQSKRFRAA